MPDGAERLPEAQGFVTALPRATASGDKALKTWLADLADQQRRDFDLAFAADPAARTVFAGIASSSPFLWKLLRADVPLSLELAGGRAVEKAREAALQLRHLGPLPELAESMAAFRRLRARFALATGFADLAGLPVSVGMELLSDFADAAVSAALRLALLDAAKSGKLTPPDAPDWFDQAGLFILAMGKHGGRELNYSSDIDLVVFYDPERVPVRAGREIQPVMVGVTQRIVKLLHEITPAGYVFRTDLRLRPDPGSTAIAMPVGAALSYYESLGQNWERAAMIKARIVAGDIEAGSAFLGELQPFIWRKYFDYAAIADIHAMKRQIHVHKGFGAIAVEGHDIKLGRGGIREIEFFVQTQQLVFGGRRPALRGARTLDMLSALRAESWVTMEAEVQLRSAYLFLRGVEHRLQMQQDEQTQRLPSDEKAFAAFAGFCGFTTAQFRKALRATFETVARHYAQLFEDAEDLAAAGGSLVFTGADHDPETLETLRRMGFAQPEAVSEMVRGWHFGRRIAVTSPRAREVLTEMTPQLLSALGKTGDGDAGMRALDEVFGRAAAAVELLALLKSNPALLELFATMLGSAPRLAEAIARRPHALDHLIDPDFARRLPDAERKARILAPLLLPESMDVFLDVLRDVVVAEKLAVGARMISGVIDPVEAGPAITLIAEAAVEAALAASQRELALRYGTFPGLEIAVLGFGKLGGREMTATSDLDLVIIYDAPDGAVSEGPRPLEPSEYAARLTQRLVAALSAPTPRGIAFDIDLRLRPSGNKGPVALLRSSFLAYQQSEAETWEQMALTRARAVAGDAAFCAVLADDLCQLIARPRDAAKISGDIAEMRGLIAREKGQDAPLDFKTGRGGLVDLEFIAQALVLNFAAAVPSVISPSTPAVFAAAGKAGLISLDDAALLTAAWRDWTSLAQAARSWFGEFNEQSGSAALKRLAAVLGLPDQRSLSGRMSEIRQAVRSRFELLVGPVGA